jgi:hypothetical protein
MMISVYLSKPTFNSKEKLVAFIKAVEFEGPADEEDVDSLEMFKKILDEKVNTYYKPEILLQPNIDYVAWLL